MDCLIYDLLAEIKRSGRALGGEDAASEEAIKRVLPYLRRFLQSFWPFIRDVPEGRRAVHACFAAAARVPWGTEMRDCRRGRAAAVIDREMRLSMRGASFTGINEHHSKLM